MSTPRQREVAQILRALHGLPAWAVWLFLVWVRLWSWDHRMRCWLMRHSGMTSG